jgi:hypothetical protein
VFLPIGDAHRYEILPFQSAPCSVGSIAFGLIIFTEILETTSLELPF